jgi:GTP-binding protein
MIPVIAIVGRPNVGKSTLFNRLVGHRSAIVHDRPGVTRDRHYDTTNRWCDRELMVIDTGGFEIDPEDDLFRAVRDQALAAVEEADVVLFVVDTRAGYTPVDEEIGRLLRRSRRPVLLVCNKVEGVSLEEQVHEFHRIGLPELFPVSAEHGAGVYELMDRVEELLGPAPEDGEEGEELVETGDTPAEGPEEIRLAVIGRPNIGKSTLVNRLLGADRHVVHDAPGTTMDAIDSAVVHDDQRYLLVDTAGVRRKARVSDAVEGFAVSRAIRTIERCHVTALMIDGTLGPTDQDARLARLVADRGRGLLVLVNKWDLVRADPERNVTVLQDEFTRKLDHLSWAPVLYISALTGKGVGRIYEAVQRIYAAFDTRISTSECNRFLEAAVRAHSVPQRHRRPVRLNYMTQVRVRPPTFQIWANTPEGVPEAYRRYLVNRLRETYGFEGTPIRMHIKRKRRPGEAHEED